MDWSTVETFKALAGKTVQTVETCPTPYGSMSSHAVVIQCTDATRVYIPVVSAAGNPPSKLFESVLPNSEDMRKAPGFFTVEDIAGQVEKEERAKRQRQADSQRKKREDLERLKRELGAQSEGTDG